MEQQCLEEQDRIELVKRVKNPLVVLDYTRDLVAYGQAVDASIWSRVSSMLVILTALATGIGWAVGKIIVLWPSPIGEATIWFWLALGSTLLCISGLMLALFRVFQILRQRPVGWPHSEYGQFAFILETIRDKGMDPGEAQKHVVSKLMNRWADIASYSLTYNEERLGQLRKCYQLIVPTIFVWFLTFASIAVLPEVELPSQETSGSIRGQADAALGPALEMSGQPSIKKGVAEISEQSRIGDE